MTGSVRSYIEAGRTYKVKFQYGAPPAEIDLKLVDADSDTWYRVSLCIGSDNIMVNDVRRSMGLGSFQSFFKHNLLRYIDPSQIILVMKSPLATFQQHKHFHGNNFTAVVQVLASFMIRRVAGFIYFCAIKAIDDGVAT